MAKQTLEKLIQGDKSIIEAYQKVKSRWSEILKDFDWYSPNSIEKMAQLVTMHQISIEHLVGERWLGQEIMVTVGIGQFYSSDMGFDDNYASAMVVYKGFLSSMCSLEVKYHAETMGKFYGLNQSNETSVF